ncbi:MAG: hypothetical protein QOD98_230, partial [Nocardioidaceae bacterium]|nr:hypothetical protein [Nocardioidaceae bacterium]
MIGPHPGGEGGEAGERGGRVAAARGDGHEAEQAQPGGLRDVVGEAGDHGGVRASAGSGVSGRPTEIDLEEYLDRPAGVLAGAIKCLGEPEPVDRVHDRAQCHHRGHLVPLELTDEMPPQRQVGKLCGLAHE